LKHVLVISFSDLATDPRVNRQIRLLATRYRVSAVGAADPRIDGVDYFHVPQIPKSPLFKAAGAMLLKLGRFERYYWMDRRVQKALSILDGKRFDAIVANDLPALPLALRLARGAKVLYDAHEYSPLEYEDSGFWRFFFQRYNQYLCGKYLARADSMLTVCRSIADEYRDRYGVTAEVVMNAPPYQELQPVKTDPGIIRLVHHGGVSPSRQLELMIEAVDYLDERFQLDMLLVSGETRYFSRLKALAAKRPRVRILPPVPMRELPARLNQYDIGIYLLPPTSFNNRYALPNKFFEFIQARLAVAIGPSPEMVRLVRQYGCGIIAEDFSSQALARQLNALDYRRIDGFKQQSRAAARDLSFEKNAETLLAEVAKMFGGS
jgi:glycosyltransferase involved in cell wall biosynthesis